VTNRRSDHENIPYNGKGQRNVRRHQHLCQSADSFKRENISVQLASYRGVKRDVSLGVAWDQPNPKTLNNFLQSAVDMSAGYEEEQKVEMKKVGL
jgi:hypothetical protein